MVLRHCLFGLARRSVGRRGQGPLGLAAVPNQLRRAEFVADAAQDESVIRCDPFLRMSPEWIPVMIRVVIITMLLTSQLVINLVQVRNVANHRSCSGWPSSPFASTLASRTSSTVPSGPYCWLSSSSRPSTSLGLQSIPLPPIP